MKKPLSKAWRIWELAKRQELRYRGLSKKESKLVASFEVRQRQAISNIVGDEAAADHDIVTSFSSSGEYRSVLVVPKDAVPAEYRARTAAWASQPSSSIQ